MGCASSKQGRSNVALSHEYSSSRLRRYPSSQKSQHHAGNRNGGGYGHQGKIKDGSGKEIVDESFRRRKNNFGILSHSRASQKGGGNNEKKIGLSYKFVRQTEGEHVVAGWPAWLTSVAGGAVLGWLPLRAERFERLGKIGQGTYSSVYRARVVDTGKTVAIKKVRFDNFHRESVRFMAREISILRRLDHPNVMKLEGIITCPISVNIYLVFEYMEHDLAGLLACPDIKFSEPQIKCYMKQLLSALEHCHSRDVIHRDIKTANILLNNDGILKVADFGLANFVRVKNAQPLTNHVVTLWYRPPELLLGSTSYNVSIDLWSVGCVFAEIFTRRPLLKGRNEVEQLHKIFKLCGSPPDEYWKKVKLPLASMFRPQQSYDSLLQERFKELPQTSVNLIETFLSIDPSKRGSASDALVSEYFNTEPHPCKPSSLPKYPPSKEIDAKFREIARRKKVDSTSLAHVVSRNPRIARIEQCDFSKPEPTEVGSVRSSSGYNIRGSRHLSSTKKPLDTITVASEATDISEDYSTVSGPIQMPSDSLAKARQHDSSSSRLRVRAISKSHNFGMASGDWKTNDIYHSSHIYQSQEQPKTRNYVDQQGSTRPVPQLISKSDSLQDTGSHQAVHRSRFYELRDSKHENGENA